MNAAFFEGGVLFFVPLVKYHIWHLNVVWRIIALPAFYSQNKLSMGNMNV